MLRTLHVWNRLEVMLNCNEKCIKRETTVLFESIKDLFLGNTNTFTKDNDFANDSDLRYVYQWSIGRPFVSIDWSSYISTTEVGESQ